MNVPHVGPYQAQPYAPTPAPAAPNQAAATPSPDARCSTLASLPPGVTEDIAGHLPLQSLAMLRATGTPFRSIAKPNVTSQVLKRRNHLDLLLKTSPNLRNLTITDPDVCDADLQLLACWQKSRQESRQAGSTWHATRRMGGLNTLGITNARSITDNGLHILGTMKGLTSISLDLHQCRSITGAGVAHIAHLTGMQALSLRGNGIRKNDLRSLTAMTQLKSLRLHEIEADDLVLFAHLQRLTALELLEVYIAAEPGKLVPSDTVRFRAFAGMKDLRELRFFGNIDDDGEAITDGDLMQIGALSQLGRLTIDAFGISHHAIGQLARLKNLEHLALMEASSSAPWRWLENLPRLKHLELRNCDDGLNVMDLAPLKNANTLISLSFNYDSFPFDARLFMQLPLSLQRLDLTGMKLPAASLALLQGMPSLSMLNIKSCRPHDAGQEWNDEALEALHSMAGLKTIDVSNCGFSEGAIVWLRHNPARTVIDESRALS